MSALGGLIPQLGVTTALVALGVAGVLRIVFALRAPADNRTQHKTPV